MNKKPQIIVIGGAGHAPAEDLLQKMLAEQLGAQIVLGGFQQEMPNVSKYGFNIPHIAGNIDLLKRAIPYTSQLSQIHAQNRVGKSNPIYGIEVRTSVVKDALASIGKNFDFDFGGKDNTVDLATVTARGVDSETGQAFIGEFVDYLLSGGYVTEDEFQKYRVHILSNLGEVTPSGGKGYSFEK